MSTGFIYINREFSHLVRLAVSLSTLRKVYSGNVTIIRDQKSYEACLKVAKLFNTDIQIYDFNTETSIWLYQASVVNYTPYDVTLSLDADTYIFKDPSDLINLASKNEFVVTKFWKDPKHWSQVERRKYWLQNGVSADRVAIVEKYPFIVQAANCTFTKDSKFAHDWHDLTLKHQNLNIPSEAVIQLYIMDYTHAVVDTVYAASARKSAITSQTVILHYYGHKHRMHQGKPVFNSTYWYKEFDLIRDHIKDWIQYDSTVVHGLPQWDIYKQGLK